MGQPVRSEKEGGGMILGVTVFDAEERNRYKIILAKLFNVIE